MKNRLSSFAYLSLSLFVLFFSFDSGLLAQPQLDWAQKINGESTTTTSIIVDSVGNIYCSGSFSGSVDFDNSSAETFTMKGVDGSGFVMKLTASGAFLWAVQFQVQHPPVLALSADGYLYVSGNSHGTNLLDLDPGPGEVWHENNIFGFADIFVVKLDANGTYIWGKAMGSDYLDNVDEIETDPVNGGVYVSGIFDKSGDFDPGPDTFMLHASVPNQASNYILRLDNEGQFLWAYSTRSDITAIETNNNAGIFLAANLLPDPHFISGVDTIEIETNAPGGFILNLSSEGSSLGVRPIAIPIGQTSAICNSNIISFDNSGNMYLSGRYTGELDFDIGSDIYSLPIMQGNNHTYFIKLSPTGAPIWGVGYSIPISSSILIYDMKVDQDGNFYAAGQFKGTVDFDAGPGLYNLSTPTQFLDAVMLKLVPDGQFSWAFRIGGTGHDYNLGLNIDNNHQLTASGVFQNSVDFDPGPVVKTLSTSAYQSGYLAKYSETNSAVFQPELSETFSVFPNPATDWIQLPPAIEGGFLSIFDELGNLSVRQLLVRESEQIYIGGLPQGNYTIFVEGGEKRQVAKFLKLRG